MRSHDAPERHKGWSVKGYLEQRYFWQRPYVEKDLYLSHFLTLGLGLRLVLGLPRLFGRDPPKNSPSLPL